MKEIFLEIHLEPLPEGRFLATNDEWPGLGNMRAGIYLAIPTQGSLNGGTGSFCRAYQGKEKQ